MNERNQLSQFGYPEGGPDLGAQPPRPRQQPPSMANYKFSPDELRVLAECNNESFYQRSLPFGIFCGLSTFAGIQRGMLKPSPRFGAFPKVTLAVVAGYFIGKLSYQQACADKLMNLPGSYIGQLLRDRRDGKISSTGLPAAQTPTMFGATAGDIYSDAGPGSALNLDTDRPAFTEDPYRSDQAYSGPASAPLAPAGPVLSYDELRQKNRGQYAGTRQDPYKVEPGEMPPITRSRLPPPAPSKNSATNKYGDDME